jgi:NAD(P)-dependent dehydrogenase (short-subunit alcohol dehydrogenase family)
MSDVDGLAVAVTGAARGLGRAYALHLAAGGARLVLNDVDAEVEEVAAQARDLGAAAVTVRGSVAEWDVAAALVDAAVAGYGRLDGAVANAGLLEPAGVLDETPERVRRQVEANLVGTVFTGVHALRAMVAAGSGSLVLTTSASAVGLAGSATYGATKAGVRSLVASWALDVAGTGVRVNGVRPRAYTRMSAARGLTAADSPPAGPVAPVVELLLGPRSAALNGVVLGFDGSRLDRWDDSAPRSLGVRAVWTADELADVVLADAAEGPRS